MCFKRDKLPLFPLASGILKLAHIHGPCNDAGESWGHCYFKYYSSAVLDPRLQWPESKEEESHDIPLLRILKPKLIAC